jgi:hypothetical protein
MRMTNVPALSAIFKNVTECASPQATMDLSRVLGEIVSTFWPKVFRPTATSTLRSKERELRFPYCSRLRLRPLAGSISLAGIEKVYFCMFRSRSKADFNLRK